MTDILMYDLPPWQVVILCVILVTVYVTSLLAALHLGSVLLDWYRDRRKDRLRP